MTVAVGIAIEGEAVGEMAEARPEAVTKDSGKASAVFGRSEASAGLLEVVIAKETIARPAKRPQIGTAGRFDLFRFTGPGQNLLDGRDGRKPANAPALELEMDGPGTDAGESGSPCLVSREFVAKG